VSVGADHDTSAFAVESLRRWWTTVGWQRYPGPDRLLICAELNYTVSPTLADMQAKT
jgi:Rhodopirellula transposase DDE domain